MNNEQILQEFAPNDVWQITATDMLVGKREVGSYLNEHAERLTRQVQAGEVSLEALQEGITWARAAHHEAVDRSGGNIDDLSGADRIEAYGRRLAHFAGSKALAQLQATDHSLAGHE